MLAVLSMVAGLILWEAPLSTPRTANDLQAFTNTETSPTPARSEAVLPEPVAISWEGYIRRVFVSGGALEIISLEVPGGAFQAYMPHGQVASVLEGSVAIEGIWRGWTCAYGGYEGHCVPDVDVQSIHQLPIVRQ